MPGVCSNRAALSFLGTFMGPVVNSSGDEWYPVFASDGSFMIFVASGRGGYGSGDLYISRFADGDWQAPQNMGPAVNTTGMDSAPYLSADDRTLYGLGGYGDLLASMALDDRPEVVLGRELGKGSDLEQAQQAARLRIEAVDLVPRLVRFAQERGLGCPMFQSILEVLDGADAEQVVRKLFEHPS